ncbi:ankyrin repeat domain-containing protein, partial [bacterium]|nr:ankyrin repeat domain-containing protein [bacterium]
MIILFIYLFTIVATLNESFCEDIVYRFLERKSVYKKISDSYNVDIFHITNSIKEKYKMNLDNSQINNIKNKNDSILLKKIIRECSINSTDIMKTPIYLAVLDDINLLNILIDYGFDINQRDYFNFTLIDWIVIFGEKDALLWLIDKKITLNESLLFNIVDEVNQNFYILLPEYVFDDDITPNISDFKKFCQNNIEYKNYLDSF